MPRVSQEEPPITSPFLRVPAEILNLIGSHLSPTSLIDLSRTSKHFELLDMRPIYQDLTLTVSPHFGEYPSTSPHPTNSEEHEAWAKVEACAAEHSRRVHLRENVKRMMVDMGKKEEWGSVRRLGFQHRAGSVHLMEAVLDYASPVLERLEIIGVPEHPYQKGWLASGTQMLDVRLFGTSLHFPSLTHIRFGGRSFFILESILDFLLLAPNLVDVEVEFDRSVDTSYPYDDSYYNESGTVLTPTKIKRIHFSWTSREEGGGMISLTDIIRCAPLLERLCLGGSALDDSLDKLVEAIQHLHHLKHLQLPITADDFRCSMEEKERRHLWNGDNVGNTQQEIFPALRCLILLYDGSEDMLFNIPPFSHLERVYFTSSSNSPAIDRFAYCGSTKAAKAEAILPPVASEFRRKTSLHSFYLLPPSSESSKLTLDLIFDGADQSSSTMPCTGAPSGATLIGSVKSLRCGERELLHARLLQDFTVVKDELCPHGHYHYPSPYTYGHKPQGFYVDYAEYPDGPERTRTFERRPDYVWAHFTDYDGIAVPLEVIEELKKVEGDVEGGWDRRGVEVRDESWAVLTRWHEEVLAERAKSTQGSQGSGV